MGADLILACFPWPQDFDGNDLEPSPELAEAVKRRLARLHENEKLFAIILDQFLYCEDVADVDAIFDDLGLDPKLLPEGLDDDERIGAAQAIVLQHNVGTVADEWFGGKAITFDEKYGLSTVYRDTVNMHLGKRTYVFSGGTSWGDDPGESFHDVNFLAYLEGFLSPPFGPEELRP